MSRSASEAVARRRQPIRRLAHRRYDGGAACWEHRCTLCAVGRPRTGHARLVQHVCDAVQHVCNAVRCVQSVVHALGTGDDSEVDDGTWAAPMTSLSKVVFSFVRLTMQQVRPLRVSVCCAEHRCRNRRRRLRLRALMDGDRREHRRAVDRPTVSHPSPHVHVHGARPNVVLRYAAKLQATGPIRHIVFAACCVLHVLHARAVLRVLHARAVLRVLHARAVLRVVCRTRALFCAAECRGGHATLAVGVRDA
jgi:hypothetical protein